MVAYLLRMHDAILALSRILRCSWNHRSRGIASATEYEGELRHADRYAGKSTMDSAQLKAMVAALKNREGQKLGRKGQPNGKSAKANGKRA